MTAFWYSLLSPALALAWANSGKSVPGLLFTSLVLLGAAFVQAVRLGFIGLKDHLLRFFGLEFVVGTFIWAGFFTFALERVAYEKWNDAEVRAVKLGAQITELTRKNADLQQQNDDKKHTFQTIEAFRTYRGYLGSERNCMILISGPSTPSVERMIDVLIQGVVPGSNCPNGNLLNIGVKPEDEEVENVKGAVPGFITFHAPSDATEANYLFGRLSNILPLKRSYTLPKPIRGHMISLQVGDGAKWSDEQ